MLFGKGFRKTALISGTIAAISVVAGILISYAANVATGGTIVLTLVLVFLLTLAIRKAGQRGETITSKKLEHKL
jgi:zinc transport system permease protein